MEKYLEEQLTEQLVQAVLSGKKRSDVPDKIKIRPVCLKNGMVYQAVSYQDTKVFHQNFGREEVLSFVKNALGRDFRQFQAEGRELSGTILVSKKGKVTLKQKRKELQTPKRIEPHNRVKRYILKEGISVPFLRDLGVMTGDGKVVSSKYDKFRQVNRFLEYLEDVLPALPRDREITILDFGCGKSYLTFAMYYYLKELRGYDVSIVGLDLKQDVIEKCSQLAEKYGYEKLHFYQGDVAKYEGTRQVDMVVTLHACDTATDYALYQAVLWKAKVILSVPCCQHELNRQIQNEMLMPALRYGIVKERMSALFTDSIRAGLLEREGYDTQLLEFIDMEHTPKNLLIRAVYTGRKRHSDALDNMMRELQVSPTLLRLLENREQYPEDHRNGVGEVNEKIL